jgi:hypothetical protein
MTKIKVLPATAQAYANMPVQSKELSSAPPVSIGGWTAVAWQEETLEWNIYSKAWHHSYGPKRTVTGRFIKFVSPSGKKSKTVELESFRGNWQLKALLDAGLVKPLTGQMHIRLNQACEIKFIGAKGGLKFYARTVKGDLLDYCVVSQMGQTFHAATPRECIKGLALKLQSAERKKEAIIDWVFLKNLGFCRDGVQEFCSVFGFDIKSSVTPAEVYARVKANPGAAQPFERELRKLAEVVEFTVPEFN